MSKNIFDDYRKEYWFHVSNQNEIPIFGHVEKRDSIDIHVLYGLAKKMPDIKQDEYLSEIIKADVTVIDMLRAIVGVTDKRMYLELSYIFNKQKDNSGSDKNILGESVYSLKKHTVNYFENLINTESDNSDLVLHIITQYLIERGVLSVLKVIKNIKQKELESLVCYLMLPKEIQQEETKRRGHGAEQLLAKLLSCLGVSYIPENRHENPMGSADPNVDKENFEIAVRKKGKTWSMDLIVKKGTAIKILIQSLIHTSDPGQYGVNKSDETVSVKQGLNKYNRNHKESKELWGLVDGVGFIENPDDTIFKMLGQFDTFIQLKSLYKAALKLHQLKIVKIKAIRFDMDFYSKEEADGMFEKYGSNDISKITDGKIPAGKEIKAGKAWIYI